MSKLTVSTVEKLNTLCPLCESPDVVAVYEREKAFLHDSDPGMKLTVSACKHCGFVFQSSAYYDNNYDDIISKTYSVFDKSSVFAFPNKSHENLKTRDLIIKHIPEGKVLNILEIGSNRGDLLHMIKEQRPLANIIGVEPTVFGYSLNVPTINAFFSNKLFSNKFDVIIMQHVLEHIKYPAGFINETAELLSDDGIFYIEVPNLQTTLKHCLDDFTTDHVNYFDESSLNAVMRCLKPIQTDVETFLRAVYATEYDAAEKTSPHYGSIETLFAVYKSNREKIIGKMKEFSSDTSKTIVFYGVSFYFRLLFKELINTVATQRCFYFDNNYTEEYEKFSGLKRLQEFNENCVVLICTNNFSVQDAIEKKLSQQNVFAIIKPWSAITYGMSVC